MYDDLRNIDLNLLLTLRTFVETGSVEETAEAMYCSQPAVSGRLRRLQEQLGVELFRKVGRQLELSPIGRRVDQRAEEILSGMRRIVDQARAASDEPVGMLKIGALPTLTSYILGETVAEFCQEYPEIEIEFDFGLIEPRLELLRKGEIDAVASVGPEPGDDLHVERLGATRPVMVGLEDSFPTDKGSVEPDDIEHLDFIGYGEIDDEFFGTVWDYVREVGLDEGARVVVPHIETVKTMIQSGFGVSILPAYTINDPTFEVRPVEGLNFELPAWMAYRRSAVPEALKRLQQRIKEHGAFD